MDAATGAIIGLICDAERELVARCRAGDAPALEQLFLEYESLILSFAYHMLGHWDDAHDVRQETFLRAFQSINRFRGDASLKSWLLTICANLCRRHHRTQQRRDVLLQEHLAALGGAFSVVLGQAAQRDPFDNIARTQTLETIVIALRSLPTAQREVLVLREVHGLSAAQIGDILGRTQGSVTILLFRARKRFAERARALLKE